MITGRLRFHAPMKIIGINPYVLVSAARARALQPGWKKPMPVRIRVNGHPKAKAWRINMMPTGKGSFYLYLHGDVRKASGTGVGDRVLVEVAFDGNYRSGPAPLPLWFRAALKASPKAKRTWDARRPSAQKEMLRYLMHLKSPQARARNVARAVAILERSAVRPRTGARPGALR
jgi:hypothetical protein